MDRDQPRGMLQWLLCMGMVIAILAASIIAFAEITELIPDN